MACFKVISADGCKWCELAIEALEAAGVEYEVITLEENPMIRSLCKLAGLKTVPQIFGPNGEYIGGYRYLHEHLSEKT